MLPFIYADARMAPAGVRAIGAAMLDCGFNKTRIVLQQWNRNFRPARMRLDGRIPDLFMVSSMQIHSAQCEGPDPRRVPDRSAPPPADHRRRAEDDLRTVGRLRLGSARPVGS